MSDFRIDQITNQAGTAGPQIAGITTFSGSSGLLMPSGDTFRRSVLENVVTDGLVLYLDAGNDISYPGSGTILRDLSGLGNNGTLQGGVGYVGTNGESLSFDKVDDLITTPYIFPTGNLPKSFSVWFKINSTTDRGWIVAGGSDANGNAFGLFRNGGSSNTLYFHGNGAAFDMIFNVSQNTTDWYNATVSYDGTTIRGYINGQLDVEKTVALNTSSSTVDFGARKNRNAAEYFKGNISQVQIYNRALTPQEIQQNYNALKGRYI